jgi:arylsulfatase A-like enzyme
VHLPIYHYLKCEWITDFVSRNTILLPVFIPLVFTVIFQIGCSNKHTTPNIILISIDSLRSDHLSCYGYARETTPNIDKLSDKSTVFLNAVSTTSWTLPAHISMFTGLYSIQHGVIYYGYALSKDIPTLPQILKDNGYYTFGIFSGPYLHPAFGFSRGFDEYKDCSSSVSFLNDDQKKYLKDDLAFNNNIHLRSHQDITGQKIYDTFSKWFENRGKDKPIFSFIHCWDVHYDFIPPPPFDSYFDPHYQGTLSPERYQSNPRINPDMCSRDLEHIIALYDGEIRWTDHIVGKILDLLKKSNMMKNTMIIITADHGEAFFEHGFSCHNNNLFDEEIRIPMIVYYPEKFPGLKIKKQVSIIDILPTIFEILGKKTPDYLHGISLLKEIEQGFIRDKPLLMELDGPNFYKAIRNDKWKFVYDYKKSLPMFFDLVNDPEEKNSLIPLSQPVVIPEWVKKDIMSGVKYYKSILDNIKPFKAVKAEKSNIDEATQKHLKSLGYVD